MQIAYLVVPWDFKKTLIVLEKNNMRFMSTKYKQKQATISELDWK